MLVGASTGCSSCVRDRCVSVMSAVASSAFFLLLWSITSCLIAVTKTSSGTPTTISPSPKPAMIGRRLVRFSHASELLVSLR